jgi:hypothetical protein
MSIVDMLDEAEAAISIDGDVGLADRWIAEIRPELQFATRSQERRFARLVGQVHEQRRFIAVDLGKSVLAAV